MKLYASLFMRPSSQQKIVGSVACHQALTKETNMGLSKNFSIANNYQFTKFLQESFMANAKNAHHEVPAINGAAKLGVDRLKVNKPTPSVNSISNHSFDTSPVNRQASSHTPIKNINNKNKNRSKYQSNNAHLPLETNKLDFAKDAEEAWRYNRRWLGVVFLIWFFLAFALLLDSIYY